MLTPILILAVFLIIAILMISRKLPTLIALPILAIVVAALAKVPLSGDKSILSLVIEGGATRLASAYVAVIFGAWLGQIMNLTGISKTIIKLAAELGGDRPFLISILMSIAIALLFTTIGGLGAVIMIGSIALPILLSVGIPATTAVGMFLFSFATGLLFNIGNWVFYINALGVSLENVKTFAFLLAGLTALTTFIYIIVEFKRQGIKFAWSARNTMGNSGFNPEDRKAPALSLVTPLIPITLVMVFNWPIIPAFLVGIIYGLVTTQRSLGQLVNLLTKSAFDGVSDSAPAVILMIGIGMVLNSLMHPLVSEQMAPFLKTVLPTAPLGYLLFFSLLAPLALYRGPLNLWGLGSGIAGLIISLGLLPAPVVMSAFLSVERVQAIADPTNTHNVWLANFAGVDVNKVLLKVLPYVWILASAGVVLSTILWF